MIDMELSADIMSQIETVNGKKVDPDASSTVVKFDDTGTLHVRSYNEDGKKCQDLSLKKRYDNWRYDKKKYDVDLRTMEQDMVTQLSKQNKLMNFVFISLVGFLMLLCLLAIVITLR